MKRHTIVCISGKQGSGKTTLAASLVKHYSGLHLKFAGPLYEMHEAIRDVLNKYGRDMKKKEGPLLQYLGTEFGRKTLGENIWVELTENAIYKAVEDVQKWDHAVIVVDDARFANELEMFFRLATQNPEWNVVTLRLKASEEARKARADGWRDDVNHASETGLDEHEDKFDFVFDTEMFNVEQIFLKACRAIEA